MPIAIFALAAVNIAIGTQSLIFAGLLSELAGDLAVSIGTAGLRSTDRWFRSARAWAPSGAA